MKAAQIHRTQTEANRTSTNYAPFFPTSEAINFASGNSCERVVSCNRTHE